MKKIKNRKKCKIKIVFVTVLLFIIISTIKYTYHKKERTEVSAEINENIVEQYENNNTQNSILVDSKLQKETDSNLADWNLILVNKNNKILDNYNVDLSYIESNHRVDSRIVNELKNMLYDARKNGLNHGYSNDKDKDLASYWVDIPGTSEHEIGLAVDIVSRSYQILDEKQEKTEVQKWLIENSYKYGFVLRYPTDKKDITMVNYEPWHYRYVGVENATYMKEKNICLEEFIEYLKQFEDDNIEV